MKTNFLKFQNETSSGFKTKTPSFIVPLSLYALSIILFLIGYFNSNSLYVGISGLVILFIAVFSDLETCMYISFSSLIFESGFKLFGGIPFWALLFVVLCLKLLFVSKQRIDILYFIPCAVIVFLNSIWDFTYSAGLPNIIFEALSLLTFYFVFSRSKSITLDLLKIFIYFSLTFFITVFFTFLDYGGISSFINESFSHSWVRFGDNVKVLCGGAMAIPIYSALIISLSIPLLFYREKKSILFVVYIAITDIMCLMSGALTISRSFFLCFIVILILFLLLSPYYKRKTKLAKPLFILFTLLVGLFLFTIFNNFFTNVTDKLISRISSDTDGSGSRFSIFSESISYLVSHPKALLFGEGAYGYELLGYSKGYLFSAGCHNFYLDLPMSWGIAGIIASIVFLIHFLKEQNFYYSVKSRPYSIIPLLVLMVFSLTAFRTTSIKPFFMFFLCLSVPRICLKMR